MNKCARRPRNAIAISTGTEWECNASTSAKPDKFYLYVSFISPNGRVVRAVERMGSCLSAIIFRSLKHNESDCLPKATTKTP